MYWTEAYIYGYTAIVLSIFGVALLRTFIFYNMCLRNSECLHNSALAALIHASMDFFEANPSGRILNRFSKDMDVIDDHLPRTMLDSGQVLLTVTGAFVITCSVTPTFLIPTLVMTFACYWIKKIYLKTSKNLKHLEDISTRLVLQL
jgi:ATP-binding cassette subfamily C (CFTR/MRP) protein 4